MTDHDLNVAARGLAAALTEYGDRDFALYMRRTFASSMGLSDEALDKPVVGIVNTYSELNNCHRLFPELVQAVKRGVWQAGGLPLEFPAISLGEPFVNPTAMMMRNLMSMDVEAMIKAQPVDSVVLMGGCDKTTPALLMGAASAGKPAVVLVSGPALTGNVDGDTVGACTDCRRYWAAYRRGELDRDEIARVATQLMPTAGTCGVMGTASTMACLVEALGMMLPGGASIPAVYADRLRCGEETGKLAVRLIERGEALAPEKILTEKAFENAMRVLLAIGGSTNGIIHLAAIAGRVGISLSMDKLNALGESTPLLVNVNPSGKHYMEHFHRAGGMRVVLHELKPLLHLDALTVTGRTLGEVLDEPYTWPEWQDVIYRLDAPLQAESALVVLRGNLAPDGAILKRSATSKHLLNRTGRAVVFTSLEDMHARINRPDLDVTPDDFLVLQNAGLLGAPGMPEAGYMPIPKKLQGVKDMVRISDARMSGTAFGTIVLHVSPEAAAGGPLGLVRDGDRIALEADQRRITLLVDDAELAARRAAMPRPKPAPVRGYERLFHQHVQQATLGADFDFLRHERLQRGE